MKLNEPDEKNYLPLDLALRSRQESIAENLVKNHIEINRTDSNGLSLLHKAIQRGFFIFNLFVLWKGLVTDPYDQVAIFKTEASF